MPRVAILCLGDVGRSPRMQYHAQAITEQPDVNQKPWEVELLGYQGSPCFPHVQSNPHIQLHLFPPSTGSLTTKSGAMRLLLAPVKVLTQITQLARILLFQLSARPDAILVQNPPSIPTLLIALIASYYHDSALLIDWHNFGYTLLGLNFGAKHPLVKVATVYEKVLGRLADGHLCVTAAMKGWLQDNWQINARVLHDRAQSHFHRLSADEVHTLFHSVLDDQQLMASLKTPEWLGLDEPRFNEADMSRADYIAALAQPSTTPFTFVSKNGEIRFRSDRPTLIMSSTSWTADEDFTILARAIKRYDTIIAKSRQQGIDDNHEPTTLTTTKRRGSKKKKSSTASSSSSSSTSTASRPLPRAIYIITGKGPLRDAFVASIASMNLTHSQVHTVFVTAGDYPLLLGSADLGVSLHYSSSGLDLPMKVVDMFGAGLPVCAVNFACIGELVVEGTNGRIFGVDPATVTSDGPSPPDPAIQLADQFHELFADFNGISLPPDSQLAHLRAGALSWSQVGWLACWNESCAPLLDMKDLNRIRWERAEFRRSILQTISIMMIVFGLLLLLL